MYKKTVMSLQQKGFWGGTIATVALFPIAMMILGWFGLRASEVPVLQEQVKVMNINLVKFNKGLEGVGHFIEVHNEDKVAWHIWKSNLDVRLTNLENTTADIKNTKIIVMAHIEHERERGQY